MRRKTSVIVHGVSEPDSSDSSQREVDDLCVLAAMMQEVGCEDTKISKAIRLGKKPEAGMKPRPIKLVLETEEEKISLLKKAKNLRLAKEGGWETVFIHQDLTPREREMRKILVQEMKERQAKGEKDLTIFNGKIVKKLPYRRITSTASTPMPTA